MKTFKVTDELGKRWIVFDGDMAYQLCKRLDAAHVAEIVLPRQTLLSGELIELGPLHFDQVPPEATEAMKLGVRLRDCLQFLSQ